MSPKLRKIERHLYLDERTGIYQWRERIDGRDLWRSTGERTIGAAREKIKKFRTKPGEQKAIERHTLDEAFWLIETAAEGQARRTLQSIKTQLAHLRPWFMGKPEDEKGPAIEGNCKYLDEFQRDSIEKWSAYKQDQAQLTPGRKLTHDRRILLQALKAAKEKGWIREFRNKDLPLLESSDPVGRIITDGELTRLMPAVRRNPRLCLQVKLALVMGMRKREILHLRLAEVDLRREVINLKGRRVKTRKGREIPIHERVLPDLKAWIRDCLGEYLFPAIYSGGHVGLNKCQNENSSAWERAKRFAKVKCRFHDLRHTAISKMLEAGMPMGTVSMITGASIAVIQRIYAHISAEGIKRAKTYDCGKFVE